MTASLESTLSTLKQLMQDEYIRAIDYFFAEFICQQEPEPNPELAILSCYLSHSQLSKHSCIDLSEINFNNVFNSEPAVILSKDWLESEIAHQQSIGTKYFNKPLILRDKHLYLQRFAAMEAAVAKEIVGRNRACAIPDPEKFMDCFQSLFPTIKDSTDVDWQAVAALLGASEMLSFVCGGPGTGKTTTAVKLLSLSIERYQQSSEIPPRVCLTAPTGKAANRLVDAIKRAKQSINDKNVQHIPDTAHTLHRLLHQHERNNRRALTKSELPYDIILVDETSMVDLALMYRFLIACDRQCQLIFLGDHYQLSSVEAGSVLADIISASEFQGFSRDKIAHFKAFADIELTATDDDAHHQSKLDDICILLEKSYRFSEQSGIYKLAQKVKNREQVSLPAFVTTYQDIDWQIPDELGFNAIIQANCSNLAPYFNAINNQASHAELTRHFESTQILCSTRNDRFGIHAINRSIEEELIARGLISLANGPHYIGQPILIEENDYRLELFNGDIGFIVNRPNATHYDPLVLFADKDGNDRYVSPYRLKTYTCVYAMTIHKSQGSEFGHVYVVLSASEKKLLSNELLYTAITRAKSQLTLLCSDDTFAQAMKTKTKRYSGLSDLLRQNPNSHPWLALEDSI